MTAAAVSSGLPADMRVEVSSAEPHALPQPTCLYQGMLGAHPHGSQATFWISQTSSCAPLGKGQTPQPLPPAPTPPATPSSARHSSDHDSQAPAQLAAASSQQQAHGPDSDLQLSATHSDTSSPTHSHSQSADGGGSSLQPSPAQARAAAGLMLSHQQQQQVQGLLSCAAGYGTRSAGAGSSGRRPERVEDPRLLTGGAITSTFRGVSFDKKKRKWRVQIKVATLGKSGVSVGYYETEEAGARAYDRAAIGLLGRNGVNCNTNFPISDYAKDQIPVLAGLTREQVKETLKSERAKQAPRRRVSNRQRTSQFMGVGSSNRKNQWQARILVGGKVTHLGYYETEQEAASVYDRVALAIHGPDAQINFSTEDYDVQEQVHLNGLSREELQRALGVKPMDKSSQYRGVSKKKGRWEAKVMVDRKWAYRELFDSETEAAAAYDTAVWRLKPREAKSYVNFKERAPAIEVASARKGRQNPHRSSASASPEDVTGYRQATRMDFEGEADDDEDDYMSEADLSDDATADAGPPGSASPEKRPRLEYEGVQPKEEPLAMEGREALQHVPTGQRSGLVSSPDRLRLRVQSSPAAAPACWGQDGDGLLHQRGLTFLPPVEGRDIAGDATAAPRPELQATFASDEGPAAMRGLPAAAPLSLPLLPTLHQMPSDLRDYASLEAFPGSPAFNQMMMSLPGNPAHHQPLLRQDGSLGSLGPLLDVGGTSGNFLSELASLQGGELSSPMDISIKQEGMDMSLQHSQYTASPTSEQVAGWGTSAASMLHARMPSQMGPAASHPFSHSAAASLVPSASTHWLNHGQPMQHMPTGFVQTQLSLPRSASAGDLVLGSPTGMADMAWDAMEDGRLLDSAPAGWPLHLLPGSPARASHSPMSLGAVPHVPSACRRPRASRLSQAGRTASPRPSNIRPVSAPVVHSQGPAAMMPTQTLSLHTPHAGLLPLQMISPAVRLLDLRSRMLAGHDLDVDECRSPLARDCQIGGEQMNLIPYAQQMLQPTSADFLLEPDLSMSPRPSCA